MLRCSAKGSWYVEALERAAEGGGAQVEEDPRDAGAHDGHGAVPLHHGAVHRTLQVWLLRARVGGFKMIQIFK